MGIKELQYIKGTIEFMIDNGRFEGRDVETSYNLAMNSLNTLENSIHNYKANQKRILTEIMREDDDYGFYD